MRGYSRTVQPRPLQLTGDHGFALGHVLDFDPDLGRTLPAGELARAHAGALAPVASIAEGPMAFEGDIHALRRYQGLVVLEGYVARSISVETLDWTELVGPGDVLRPWTLSEHQPSLLRIAQSWEALTWARLAILDDHYARRTAEWPELTATLIDRVVHRAHILGANMTMCRLITTDARLLHYFWNLADRWGKVRRDGILVELPRTTHSFLGRLVGAHRQSVTTALAKLRDNGLMERVEGGFLLNGDRPPPFHAVPTGAAATLPE
jgi:CRP/FNR family cyclic AMP-dependent transcriptional regulator